MKALHLQIASPEESNDKCNKEDLVADVVEDKIHADVYVLELVVADASPDKLRARPEDVLNTLSYNFRTYPTLPADAANSLEPLARAYDEDCAILLPLKHCAFMGCKWCGGDAKCLAVHIVTRHLDLLEEGLRAYEIYRTVSNDSEETIALSIYNEGIAIAIRRGAPLASCSVDRTCLS